MLLLAPGSLGSKAHHVANGRKAERGAPWGLHLVLGLQGLCVIQPDRLRAGPSEQMPPRGEGEAHAPSRQGAPVGSPGAVVDSNLARGPSRPVQQLLALGPETARVGATWLQRAAREVVPGLGPAGDIEQQDGVPILTCNCQQPAARRDSQKPNPASCADQWPVEISTGMPGLVSEEALNRAGHFDLSTTHAGTSNGSISWARRTRLKKPMRCGDCCSSSSPTRLPARNAARGLDGSAAAGVEVKAM